MNPAARCPGVEVQVTQTATGVTRFVVTDERGQYVLGNLPIGPYKLEAKLQGFNTYERTGLTLTVGASPVINVDDEDRHACRKPSRCPPMRRWSRRATPASARR